MNDMGMNMSLQKMDMNTVMYPEISGESMKMKHANGYEIHKSKSIKENKKVKWGNNGSFKT
jgi:hypothetical protein